MDGCCIIWSPDDIWVSYLSTYSYLFLLKENVLTVILVLHSIVGLRNSSRSSLSITAPLKQLHDQSLLLSNELISDWLSMAFHGIPIPSLYSCMQDPGCIEIQTQAFIGQKLCHCIFFFINMDKWHISKGRFHNWANIGRKNR